MTLLNGSTTGMTNKRMSKCILFLLSAIILTGVQTKSAGAGTREHPEVTVMLRLSLLSVPRARLGSRLSFLANWFTMC